ncbi:MAG: CPBP family glutamic-type intramembrane protease, partial [Desulfobacteraceae bacterium]|nr:CPBP family glutamic-type intramembrane protease [Desulfobacteraceae bacterium]
GIVSILWGVVFGIIGTVLWVACLFPFVKPVNTAWSNTATMMRLLSATVLVPVFEELVMRVYVFRIAYQWGVERKKKNTDAFENALHEKSLNDVKPGEWSIYAVVCSTVIFAMGHQAIEWPAAVIYGLLMAFLLITRKDILSCIIAHATTNLTLGLYVYVTGKWQYW